MPLDAPTRNILDRIAKAGYPPLHTHPAPVARQLYAKTSPLLDAPNIPIGSSDDRVIDGPDGPIPIRILRPVRPATAPSPAIVFFHGGGFVLGSIDSHDVTCRILANAAGFPLISVDYRLAPEHKFPAGLNDCISAAQWVADHAASLGIDPSRIAVAGDSAGGNLAAVVAQISRDEPSGPPVAFQLLIYPAVDAHAETASKSELATGYMLEKGSIDWFNLCYVDDPEDWNKPKASPLRAASFEGLAPAYVITAGFDPLRDEGAAYAEALRLAGVDVTYINYESTIHGFFNMTGVIDLAIPAIEAAGRAVRAALQ